MSNPPAAVVPAADVSEGLEESPPPLLISSAGTGNFGSLSLAPQRAAAAASVKFSNSS